MSNGSGATPSVRRIDKVLAFMSLGLLALSIGCFFSTIIGTAVGADQTGGAWPVVFVVQMYGPILAFVLLIALLVMSFVRRGRANRQ